MRSKKGLVFIDEWIKTHVSSSMKEDVEKAVWSVPPLARYHQLSHFTAVYKSHLMKIMRKKAPFPQQWRKLFKSYYTNNELYTRVRIEVYKGNLIVIPQTWAIRISVNEKMLAGSNIIQTREPIKTGIWNFSAKRLWPVSV